jgi:hypothetical protein
MFQLVKGYQVKKEAQLISSEEQPLNIAEGTSRFSKADKKNFPHLLEPKGALTRTKVRACV